MMPSSGVHSFLDLKMMPLSDVWRYFGVKMTPSSDCNPIPGLRIASSSENNGVRDPRIVLSLDGGVIWGGSGGGQQTTPVSLAQKKVWRRENVSSAARGRGIYSQEEA